MDGEIKASQPTKSVFDGIFRHILEYEEKNTPHVPRQ
jgi:hypothetical protein